jgi:hypothetical protein
MTVYDRGRGRALDGDPTLSSNNHTPPPPRTAQNKWQHHHPHYQPPTAWAGDESFETQESPPQPRFLIPLDHDDISSIDRPLMTSAIGSALMTSALSVSHSTGADSGDLPTLRIRDALNISKISKTSSAKNPDTSYETAKAGNVVSPSDPLRYRRTNSQQRRQLAQKILQARKRMSPQRISPEKKKNLVSAVQSSRAGQSMHERQAPVSQRYGGINTITGALNSPTEPEFLTQSPTSDDTVSWASTLTTNPSRFVSPPGSLKRGEDENSRQIPYARMDALASVKETDEHPPSRLDRHFQQQQRSTTPEQSSKRKLAARQSFRPLAAANDDASPMSADASPVDPNENHQHDVHQYDNHHQDDNQHLYDHQYDSNQQDSLQYGNHQHVATDPKVPAPINLDQRDDGAPGHPRTYSGGLNELPETYPLSAPDRTAQSDPGGGLSALAMAAAQWPQRSESRPASLVNYGNTHDVLVTLHPSGETFEHASHILAYASPVLRQQLRPVLGGWYRLDLHQTSNMEWQLVQSFLEPHSVQSAVVTPRNLAHLLPWFVQLQLDILLVECDQLLVTLDFPKAYYPEGPDSSKARKTPPPPQKNDMLDILVLSEISSLAHLTKTSEKVLETLESYLALHPGLAIEEETLPVLMRLLRDHPAIRQRLWRRTLIRFLPADMPLFNRKEQGSGDADLVVVEAMVYNPLFPYLLREGMSKAAKEDEFQRRSQDLDERWKRFRERQQQLQQTSQVWSSTLRQNSIIEEPLCRSDLDDSADSTIGSLSISRSEKEDSVTTTKIQMQHYLMSQSPLSMMGICDDTEDFEEWWKKWSHEAAIQSGTSLPATTTGSSLQQSLASIRSRSEAQKLKEELEKMSGSSDSRTHFLESIIRRLGRPPIFPPIEPVDDGEVHDVPLPSAGRNKDRRKFLC